MGKSFFNSPTNFFYDKAKKEIVASTKYKTLLAANPNLYCFGSLQKSQLHNSYYLNSNGEICREKYGKEVVFFTTEQIQKF